MKQMMRVMQSDTESLATKSLSMNTRNLIKWSKYYLPIWGILAIALGMAFGAFAQTTGPTLILGGNVNERFQWATPQVLNQTHTTWIRGFIPASEFISGERSYQSDAGLNALKQAANSGHRIILTIKWDSSGKGDFGRMPVPGSQEEKAAFAFIDHLLYSTAGSISALVITNEIVVDTLAADLVPGANGQIPVVTFLRRVAEHIDKNNWKASDGNKLPLFAGGMTRLDRMKNQEAPITQAMIEWINNDPKITGADFHLHQPNLESTQTALKFMHESIPNKPLMVTEMSLVWKWKAHLQDRIDSSQSGQNFSKKYSLPPGTTVAEFINQCFQNPVSQDEWQQFLASQSWFTGHYLAKVIPLLQANDVEIATYALTWNPQPQQARQPIGPHTVPWFLNQLLVPGMAYAPDSSSLPENYELFLDYRNYQDGLLGHGNNLREQLNQNTGQLYPHLSNVMQRLNILRDQLKEYNGHLNGKFGSLMSQQRFIREQTQDNARLNGGDLTEDQEYQLNKNLDNLQQEIHRNRR